MVNKDVAKWLYLPAEIVNTTVVLNFGGVELFVVARIICNPYLDYEQNDCQLCGYNVPGRLAGPGEECDKCGLEMCCDCCIYTWTSVTAYQRVCSLCVALHLDTLRCQSAVPFAETEFCDCMMCHFFRNADVRVRRRILYTTLPSVECERPYKACSSY